MSYQEPGVTVIQLLQRNAANIQGGDQVLTLVGELYEMFDDEVHDEHYDPVTGAGDQTLTWPGKKTSSVVDFAGVRKSIAEVDSQLNEYAPYPLVWRLRDPSTSETFDLNPLTDVNTLNQTGFKIVEGASAATARSAASTATSSKDGEFHVQVGGLLSAGLVAGDRMRLANGTFTAHGDVTVVQDDNVAFAVDGHDAVLDANTLVGAVSFTCTSTKAPISMTSTGILTIGAGDAFEHVAYSAHSLTGLVHTFTVSAMTNAHDAGDPVHVQIVDVAALTPIDCDLFTDPNYIDSATGGFALPTSKVGSRVAMWLEVAQVNDGVCAGGSKIVDQGTLGATSTNVGDKLAIWSSDVADGGIDTGAGTVSGTGTIFTVSAGTPFLVTHVGHVIKLDTAYVRITGYTSSTVVTISTGHADGAVAASQLYGQVVRTIMAVNESTGDLTVDGANLQAGTTLPLVLLAATYRDLIVDTLNTDTRIKYSGSAVSSDTGFLWRVPVDVFNADLPYEVFPDYELLVTYRALDISSVNQKMVVYESTDVAALGTVDKNNPLTWAAQAALVAMGTTDTAINILPVDLYTGVTHAGYPEDRVEAQAYLDALSILEMDDSAYYLVPLTRNSTVRDAFVTHVLAMSAAEEKKERICYLSYALPLGDMESLTGVVAPGLNNGNKNITDVGQEFLSQHHVLPGNVVVISAPASIAGEYEVAAGSTDDVLVLDGADWTKTAEFTITDGNFDAVSGELASSTPNAFRDVEVGDYLVKGSATRRITAIKTAYTVLEYEGVALTGTAQTVSIYRSHVGVSYYVRPMDEAAQATALATIASSRGQRRVVHMWPDNVEMVTGTSDQGAEIREMVSSIFSAAAEAGRDSVIPPQRSSTGAALAGFTGLEHSNTYFKRSQLNTIAGGGWAILEQRATGAAVTMRHLLTTDMSSVKTQEVSFTKNVDNMAKVKRASLEPLLNDENGRVNITQQFLSALAFPLQAVNERFVANEQLVATPDAPAYKILSITIDPTAADTILDDEELNVPLPANKLTVTFVI